MSQGTALLEEALLVARQEESALERGEYDEAIELAQKRNTLTGMAWNAFDHNEKDSYHKCLLELSNLQIHLTDLAKRAHETLREKLSRSRQEKKRMRGYHLAVGQALQ